MYTYEERLKALELYVKLGKRSGATIRQLGYPTKNSLKKWHQEFLKCGDLHVAYARSKRKYSVEQMNVAIEHYMNHGRCFSTTIKALAGR
jgi:putative transposase